MYVYINANGDRVLTTPTLARAPGLRPSIVTAMTDPRRSSSTSTRRATRRSRAADANGFPNRKSFVTDFITGAPLFVDTHGLRTDVSPTTLVVDNAGADITVYALASESRRLQPRSPSQVSTNGTTWHSTTALATAVRVPGDGGHPLDHVKSYDIGDNNGTQYKYIRIIGTGDFKLDARRDRRRATAGPRTRRSRRTSRPSSIASLTTVPTSESRRRRRRAERRLHAAHTDRSHHARLERPRPAGADPRQPRRAIPFTRTADDRVSYPGGDDTLVVDASHDSGIDGTLDSVSQRARPDRHRRRQRRDRVPRRHAHRAARDRGERDHRDARRGARVDPSLLVVIAEQTLVSGHGLHDEHGRQHGHAHRLDHRADGRPRELPDRRRRHADAELLARAGEQQRRCSSATTSRAAAPSP